MKYKVWQVIKPNFGLGKKPLFPADYELVAEVECKDLEDAFRATNTIDDIWTKNPEVIQLHKRQCRSTSVGDVLEDEDGIAMYCAPCGWDEIETRHIRYIDA